MADEDWNEYRRLVLAELERLTERIDGLSSQISTMQAAIAVLQFRAGLWGALAGAIPGAIAILWAIYGQK